MKRTAILIAALTGALLASQVQAQQPGQNYFGFSYGAVHTEGASPYSNTLDEDTAGGFRVYGGTLWENGFGMELGYYGLGKYNVNIAAGKIAESETNAIAVSGVMASALGAGYSLHLKAGLAFTEFNYNCVALCGTLAPVNANTTKRGVAGLLGVGIGAALAQDVTMRVDYEHIGAVNHQLSTTGYKSPYDILSVSIQFNF